MNVALISIVVRSHEDQGQFFRIPIIGIANVPNRKNIREIVSCHNDSQQIDSSTPSKNIGFTNLPPIT